MKPAITPDSANTLVRRSLHRGRGLKRYTLSRCFRSPRGRSLHRGRGLKLLRELSLMMSDAVAPCIGGVDRNTKSGELKANFRVASRVVTWIKTAYHKVFLQKS